MRGGKKAEDRRDERERERPCAYVRCEREGDGVDARGDIPMAGGRESGAWAAVGEGRERKKV